MFVRVQATGDVYSEDPAHAIEKTLQDHKLRYEAMSVEEIKFARLGDVLMESKDRLAIEINEQQQLMSAPCPLEEPSSLDGGVVVGGGAVANAAAAADALARRIIVTWRIGTLSYACLQNKGGCTIVCCQPSFI